MSNDKRQKTTPTDRTIVNAEGEEETIRYCGTVDARDARPVDYYRTAPEGWKPGWNPNPPQHPNGYVPDLEECERRLFRNIGICTEEGKRISDRLAQCIVARLSDDWGPADIIEGGSS